MAYTVNFTGHNHDTRYPTLASGGIIAGDLTIADNLKTKRLEDNIWFVSASDAAGTLEGVIADDAAAGDIVICGPGTHTLTARITPTKNLSLMGMGRSITTLNSTAISTRVFSIGAYAWNISDLCISHAYASNSAWAVMCATGSTVRLRRVNVEADYTGYTNGAAVLYADSAGGLLDDCIVTMTATGGSAISSYKTSALAANATYTLRGVVATATGGPGLLATSGGGARTVTFDASGCRFTGTTYGASVENEYLTLLLRQCILQGTTADLRQTASGVVTAQECLLVNALSSGTITNSGRLRVATALLSGGLGVFGTAPPAARQTYAATNVTPDRTFNADATSTAELADVVGTIIADLKLYGFFA